LQYQLLPNEKSATKLSERNNYGIDHHRRTGYGPIFSRGAETSVPEKFFVSARKTATLTCKITLPDSPHPVISKNPEFRALYLAWRNEFRFYRLTNTIFFIFGCWLLLTKFSFCPKNTELPESVGPQPPWLIRLCGSSKLIHELNYKNPTSQYSGTVTPGW